MAKKKKSPSIVVKVEEVPVDDLLKHPRNPRRGDIEKIKESLQVNGQYRPIIANLKTRHVLAGNHTLEAARQLGWKTIQVAWVDVDENAELRILLADNRTSDLATYDNEELNRLLSELAEADGSLFGTGFDLEDIVIDVPDEVEFDEGPRERKVRITLLIAPEEEMLLRDALVDLAAKLDTLEVR